MTMTNQKFELMDFLANDKLVDSGFPDPIKDPRDGHAESIAFIMLVIATFVSGYAFSFHPMAGSLAAALTVVGWSVAISNANNE